MGSSSEDEGSNSDSSSSSSHDKKKKPIIMSSIEPKITINQKYAKEYLSRKRSQELKQIEQEQKQHKKVNFSETNDIRTFDQTDDDDDDSSSSSTSESED